MKLTIDIAEAVQDHLIAAGYDAVRAYRAIFRLKDIKELRLTVVPRAAELEIASRQDDTVEVQIDVAIQKRVAIDALDEIDACMDHVSAIQESLNRVEFGDIEARWVGAANDPIFIEEHLDQHHVFTSILTLRYRANLPKEKS